ncbi:ribosomal RNA processing protein 36 homolog [Manacus candei]|uniref:ribosomal RNA processing protein 36 homolog n=1 Tax=Manacus candei TaxID=415023 RepID=UPI002226072E|nr:ribosomal RNA processing protein 36 homolog [Manacus candei]
MRPRRDRAGRGRVAAAAAAAATEGEEDAVAEQPLGRLEAAEGDGDSDDDGSLSGDEEAEAAGPGGRGERGPGGSASDQSDMSFEELLQMQSDARTRVCKQMTSGKKTSKPTKATVKQQQGKKGPLEISAKKPVPFLRQVVSVRKKVHRDPRFDDLSGEYKPEIFMKTYSFLDSIKKQEKEMVQKQLKKCRNMEQKEKLQQLLNPEKRKLELAEKYAELKRSGKLESFLNKKRKRNAIKDKRRLPSQKNL